jgi:hypothetical protein
MAALLAGWTIVDAQAQTPNLAEQGARLDSVLAARYYDTPYDSNYVVRPEGRLTLKVRMNQTGNSFMATTGCWGVNGCSISPCCLLLWFITATI